MKHGLNKIIWMTAGIVSLSSCIKEIGTGDPPGSGETALVKIETFVIGGGDLDNQIKSVRIITFFPGGFVTGNTFYDETYLDATGGTIVHEMKSGVYDFVFIANENNGAEQNDLQAAVFTGSKKKSDLNNILIPANLFNQTDVIPMLTGVDNVTVYPGNGGIKVDNGAVQTTWPVQMKRLAIRIDMTLKSKVNLESQFKGVAFPNVANAVPLTGNYSGAQSTARTITVAGNPANFEPYTLTQEDTDAGYVWGKKVVRIILPSHMFADKTNTDKALKMELTLDGWSGNPSATIGYNEPSDNTLPPNTNFIGEGIIGPLLSVHLKVADWDVRDADGDIDAIRTLNVSAIKKYMIDNAAECIYFNSNQKNVCIDAMAKNSAGADVNVNTILQNLTTTNFHYDYNAAAGTGTGYMDLSPAGGATGGIYKIYLDAGGLRREIKVAIMKTNIVQITTSAYVGTFHRWNETDERRITIPGTGNAAVEIQGDWVAIVVCGDDWIRLDTEAFGSNGGRVGMGTSPVDGNATASVPIRFRVGLTGNHPSGSNAGSDGNAQPRYGLIYVYYGNDLSKVHPIYVRQGEASDYLMRNIDEDNPISGPMAGVQRTLAAKFSPYNLTDPNGGTGRVGTVTGTKYSFTKYPSQAGYYFQWYQTWAWSPAGTEATNWISTNSSSALWDPNKTLWESCPAGYRRVKDGSTTEYITLVASTASLSELRQSLFLNPQNRSIGNMNNSVWGFLADGFFDRGTITTPEGDRAIANTAVSPGTANVAYIGRLFYNPNNNASVFLPGSGMRLSNTGSMLFAGDHGFSWSSTSSSTEYAWVRHAGGGAANQLINDRKYGYPVRCVRE